MVISIKYQWLLEHQQLEEDIFLLKWKINKAELELQRWLDPRDLGRIKITNESKSAHLEEDIKRLKAYLNEKQLNMEALMMMINRFKGLDNKILKMKYIEGFTLEGIAEELHYSSSYIYKKHAEVIKTIKFVESLE